MGRGEGVEQYKHTKAPRVSNNHSKVVVGPTGLKPEGGSPFKGYPTVKEVNQTQDRSVRTESIIRVTPRGILPWWRPSGTHRLREERSGGHKHTLLKKTETSNVY